MSASPSKWLSMTDLHKTIDVMNRDKFFDSVDARQRELDEERRRSRAKIIDRKTRASSFFEDMAGPASRFERGHSIAGFDSDTTGRSEVSNWSRRTRSSSSAQQRSVFQRTWSHNFNSTAPGNLLELDTKAVRAVRMDRSPQSSPVPPASADDALFVKPTLPSITRLKPPRIYSSEPISRSRLTIPKRRFSPEPENKYAKALSGSRRPPAEIVDLIDLKRVLQVMPSTEFDIPHNFTPRYRKRTSMVADAIATPPVPEKKASLIGENLNTPPSLIHIPPIPFSETVDFSLPASFSRECTPIRASSHLSTRPSSQICTAATSSASSIRTRMTNTSLIGDRGSRELRRPLRYRTTQAQETPLARSSRIVKKAIEESGVIETPKDDVEGRVTRRSVREKDEHEESPARDVCEGEEQGTASGKEKATAEDSSGVTAVGSFEVGLMGEEDGRRESSEDGELNADDHRPKQSLSNYADEDEESALHIVEAAEDDEVASSEERTTEKQTEQQLESNETSSKVLHGELLLSQSENE